MADIFHHFLYTVTARTYHISVIHYTVRPYKKSCKTRKSYGKDEVITNEILEAFVEDNPSSDPTAYRGNSEHRKALEVKYNSVETLSEKLDDEEKKLFEQYCDARSDENRTYEMDKFIHGCKVGVLMMIGVFTGVNDLFPDNEEKTA